MKTNFLNETRESLWIAWAAIRASKMRSGLATLAIVIGIVTVTLMGTAITGLNRAFLKSISAVGADVLYVQRFQFFVESREEFDRMRKNKPIRREHAEEVGRQLTLARAVAPCADARLTISSGKRKSSGAFILGTTEQMSVINGVGVTQGRYLSAIDVEGGRPVCVLGSEVAANLFPGQTAVGKRVRIQDSSFEVIGVLEKQGSFLGLISLDNQAVISINQFESQFWNNPECEIQVKALSVADLEDTREELRTVMRRVRHIAPGKPDDFAINQQDQFVKMFNNLAGTISIVGLCVTGLSLFVGGIGIMNIMFVSVTERTREIGIRKAIGAKRRTILLQFLIESAAICFLGGLIAVGIAWPITLLMGRFFPAVMSAPVAGLALLVALLTGLISGIVPAWRAASMNPVDALRNE